MQAIQKHYCYFNLGLFTLTLRHVLLTCDENNGQNDTEYSLKYPEKFEIDFEFHLDTLDYVVDDSDTRIDDQDARYYWLFRAVVQKFDCLTS